MSDYARNHPNGPGPSEGWLDRADALRDRLKYEPPAPVHTCRSWDNPYTRQWCAGCVADDKNSTLERDAARIPGRLSEADRLGISPYVWNRAVTCDGCSHAPHIGQICLNPSYVDPRGTCGHLG